MQLTETDQKRADELKAQMKELSPRLWELKPFTRPLGKSQVSFEEAREKEEEYNRIARKFNRLESQLRKIYKNNGKAHL
jgi:DNA repair exonuclease SbcCD ATPase subunit